MVVSALMHAMPAARAASSSMSSSSASSVLSGARTGGTAGMNSNDGYWAIRTRRSPSRLLQPAVRCAVPTPQSQSRRRGGGVRRHVMSSTGTGGGGGWSGHRGGSSSSSSVGGRLNNNNTTIETTTTTTTFGPSSKKRNATRALALPETLFSIGTVAVLPLYGMMIGAPQASVSKRTMSSVLPFALMGCLYAVAACLILRSAGAQHIFSTFMATAAGHGAATAAGAAGSIASFAAHALTLLSGCMATAETAAAAWLHLLSLDLFVARHVYLDALRTATPARHSLVLCCMFGPVGYLSHTLTKGLTRR